MKNVITILTITFGFSLFTNQLTAQSYYNLTPEQQAQILIKKADRVIKNVNQYTRTFNQQEMALLNQATQGNVQARS